MPMYHEATIWQAEVQEATAIGLMLEGALAQMQWPEIETIGLVEAHGLLQITTEVQEVTIHTELHLLEAVEATIEAVQHHLEAIEVLDEVHVATRQVEAVITVRAVLVPEVTVAAVLPEAAGQVAATVVQVAVLEVLA